MTYNKLVSKIDTVQNITKKPPVTPEFLASISLYSQMKSCTVIYVCNR